jgi:regulator of protease activity HflC (stomatin/prohibitin superfamily)
MGFIFLAVILALIGIVCVWIGKSMPATLPKQRDRYSGNVTEEPNFYRRSVIAGGIAIPLVLIALIGGFRMFKTVENGHIGIVKEFGSLVDTTGEGFVTIAPWRSLTEVSVQNEIRTYGMGMDKTDQMNTTSGSAVSRDSQAIFIEAVVNYSLQRDKAVKLYRETGGQFVERILDPAVYQNTKEVTARYKAIDFAQNREVIRQDIERALAEEVQKRGITINSVSLKNVDFTDAFAAAIEQTVEAEQQAKREEAKVRISEAQAEQVRAVAEGERDKRVLEATGEAQAIRLKGQALRQNPQVLSLTAIETLNPKVQLIVPEGSDLVLPGVSTGAAGATAGGE